MRAVVAVSALAAALAVLLAGALWSERARARHLAVPVLTDPSLVPAEPAAVPEPLPGCASEELARAPGRVTAVLPASDGALWIGTFDAGLLRRDPDGRLEDVGLAGPERFVNALAEHDGLVWAATQRGVVAFDGTRRVASALEDSGVSALVRAGPHLYAGGSRGLFRAGVGGAEDLRVSGPSGEPLRVNALAVSGGTLWIGTASGAYAIGLATLEAPLLSRAARWVPLVFGSPPAETNVVTALAPVAGGAVAGTDDGGLVLLREGAEPAAARLADRGANEVNPGAAAAVGEGAALGTQGGGILLARADAGRLAIARPAGLEHAAVSAVWSGADEILAGTAEGAVVRLRCPARIELPAAPEEGGRAGEPSALARWR